MESLGFAWFSLSNNIFSAKTISTDIELLTIGKADIFRKKYAGKDRNE